MHCSTGLLRTGSLLLGLHCCGALCLCAVNCRPAAAAEPAAADNPYLAGPQLSRDELGEFVRRMQTKPASLRKRAGFNEAIVDAADRILNSGEQDELAVKALLAKLAALHYLADHGGTASDEQLAKLAASLAEDQRPEVAEPARFYRLERQALDADTLAAEDLPALVDELKKYCQSHELDARHLRLASATVKIINRLPDDKAAAEAYREFGSRFAASEDPELSRYGRKIQSGPKVPKGKIKAKPDEKPAEKPDGEKRAD